MGDTCDIPAGKQRKSFSPRVVIRWKSPILQFPTTMHLNFILASFYLVKAKLMHFFLFSFAEVVQTVNRTTLFGGERGEEGHTVHSRRTTRNYGFITTILEDLKCAAPTTV